MANAEHLEILNSGVEHWNKWKKNTQLEDIDLSEAKLSGAKLFEVDLSGVNLSNVDLSGADLFNANMPGADLYKANLSKCDLSGVNFDEADLCGANLTEAYMYRAYLYGADLSHADLSGSDLNEVNFCETKLENTNFRECIMNSTIFGLTDLSSCFGLSTVQVEGQCIIDFQTLRTSKNLPKSFLLKIGLPELYIDYLPEFYMDALNLYPAFLSHSHFNKPFARKLYEALIAKGVNVFFDEKKLKPGDDFYEGLSKGIDYYDKMILVCSKESLTESWWVDREIDRVLAKERKLMKERGYRVNLLIPIRIDDYIFEWQGAKKEEILRYLIGDFREWENEEKFGYCLEMYADLTV